MNKFVIIGIVVLLVLGGGGYFLLKNQSGQSPLGQPSNQQPSGSGETFTGSLSSLLTLGQSYTCTFDGTDEVGNSLSGTVYVAASGDKLNGEFMMSGPQGESQSNVIRDGDYNYIWSDMFEEGYKVKVEEGDTSIFGDETSDETSAGISDTENFDFNCSPWVVNNSKFTPPSDINFIDLSEQMMMLENESESALQSQCATCDQVPAEAKAQCLEALNCN